MTLKNTTALSPPSTPAARLQLAAATVNSSNGEIAMNTIPIGT